MLDPDPDINELRDQLELNPHRVEANRRMMMKLLAEGQKGEALIFGLRGVEVPAVSAAFYRSLVRLLVDLQLPRLAAAVVIEAAGNNVVDEKTSVIACRALRRRIYHPLRAKLLDLSLKHFPESEELQAIE